MLHPGWFDMEWPIRDCESLCLSDETVKAVGPFYLVSMPGEVKDPTSSRSISSSGRRCPDVTAKLFPVLCHSACRCHRTERIRDVFLPSLSWLSSASFPGYHSLHYWSHTGGKCVTCRGLRPIYPPPPTCNKPHTLRDAVTGRSRRTEHWTVRGRIFSDGSRKKNNRSYVENSQEGCAPRLPKVRLQSKSR